MNNMKLTIISVSPKTLAVVFEHCLDQLRSPRSSQQGSRSSSNEASQDNLNQDPKFRADIAETPPKVQEIGSSTRNVLLVEDNPINLKV